MGMPIIPLPVIVKVVGVSFHRDEVVRVKVGDQVVVRHDPDNPYDSNACVVETGAGGMLGHVPAPVAARLIRERTERSWTGSIAEVFPGEHYGVSIRIEAAAGAGDSTGEPVSRPGESVVAVRAKSGRMLGRLVRQEDGKVVVANEAGVEFGYPRELVLVD
jgi:hypothetical protein